jgi:hypothetical protein
MTTRAMKNNRIKKQWKRAMKKRRIQENRLVREVAQRLIGKRRIQVWNATKGYFEGFDHV